jgi:MoxR-like ATPase
MVEVTTQTRRHADVYLGASPRGSLALFRAAQVRATLHARDYVIPDDVKALADAALAHRIIIGPAARIKNVDARAVVKEVLTSVPVPGGSQLRRE